MLVSGQSGMGRFRIVVGLTLGCGGSHGESGRSLRAATLVSLAVLGKLAEEISEFFVAFRLETHQ